MSLRVALFPADQGGCGMYRMRLPAAASGIDTVFPDTLTVRRSTRDWSHIIGATVDADIAVIQRPMRAAIVDAIPHLQRAGVAVVIELDDDFGRLHAQHPAFQLTHPTSSPDLNWRHLQRACRLADLVTVSTPALAQRYRPDALVLPNCVPERLLTIRAERDGRTVGWGGATVVHPGDLDVTRGGVAQAVADTGARFLNIGPGGVARQLGFATEPDATGGLPFDRYHQALAQLDVGIVPLADTAFNAAKSALKGLEYAALGIPYVASPTPEYQRLHDLHGLGLIARDRSRDWRNQTRRLLTDASLRDEIAEHGREQIAEHHVMERNGWRWAEAWEHAAEIRNATPRERIAA